MNTRYLSAFYFPTALLLNTYPIIHSSIIHDWHITICHFHSNHYSSSLSSLSQYSYNSLSISITFLVTLFPPYHSFSPHTTHAIPVESLFQQSSLSWLSIFSYTLSFFLNYLLTLINFVLLPHQSSRLIYFDLQFFKIKLLRNQTKFMLWWNLT